MTEQEPKTAGTLIIESQIQHQEMLKDLYNIITLLNEKIVLLEDRINQLEDEINE